MLLLALNDSALAMKLSLPPPLKSNVPGTWAHDTMSRRVSADIFPRLIADNADRLNSPVSASTADSFLQLNDLRSSLDCGRSGYLREIIDGGPDADTWRAILATQSEDERNWLDADWVVAEFYFYRRVAEAFRYFETGYDFFQKQKVEGLLEALPSIESVAERVPALLLQDASVVARIAVLTSLWGNKMDLSLWPASTGSRDRMLFGDALQAGKEFILSDDTDAVVALLARLKGSGRRDREVGVIVDNAGYELVSDLLLSHLLLASGCCDRVTLHTKAHPTFVSDATTNDVLGTVDLLRAATQSETGLPYVCTNKLGEALQAHIAKGEIAVVDDLFWCQPTAFWDMPEAVAEKVKPAAVVFVKGDANYRRLLVLPTTRLCALTSVGRAGLADGHACECRARLLARARVRAPDLQGGDRLRRVGGGGGAGPGDGPPVEGVGQVGRGSARRTGEVNCFKST